MGLVSCLSSTTTISYIPNQKFWKIFQRSQNLLFCFPKLNPNGTFIRVLEQHLNLVQLIFGSSNLSRGFCSLYKTDSYHLTHRLERRVVHNFLSSVGQSMGLVRSQSRIWASGKQDNFALCQSLFGPISCAISRSMTTPLLVTCHCSLNKASQYEWLRNRRRSITQNEHLSDGGYQCLPPYSHHSRHLWYYVPRILLGRCKLYPIYIMLHHMKEVLLLSTLYR